MKSYKILIFIFLIITILGILCAIFPVNGITIGSFQLRFPSLEKILVRNNNAARDIEQELREKELAIQDSTLRSLQDSVLYYQQWALTHDAHFYFPNDDATFFHDMFAKMDKAQNSKEVVRILHYGDSQIELDRISSNLRDFFQGKFGGGGPGLIPAVRSVATTSFFQSSSESFKAYTTYGEGARTSNGDYGIMAKAYQLDGSGNISVTANKNFGRSALTKYDHIRLLVSDQTGALSATLRDKTNNRDYPKTSSKQGLQVIDWKLDSACNSFSLNLTGSARIYGVMVDNGYGVSVDNVPMRGCSGTIFTKISDSLLAESYAMMNVGLIIMQYGGNAMPGMSEKGVDSYTQRIGNQIRFLQKACPNAKILFIGPADMSTMVNGELRTYPHLPKVVEALKKVVTENGAAFWDMYTVMGGENSMIAWAKSGLAGNDYVHFTNVGANKIGGLLVGAFSQLYDLYVLENKKSSLNAKAQWAIQK